MVDVKLDTDKEIEGFRQDHLAAEDRNRADEDPDIDDSTWRERFEPGTFGCHEALHMSSVFRDMVDEQLLQHPSVLMDEEAFRLAYKAQEYLFYTYQRLGEIHLNSDGENPAV